jgi:DNA-binding NarL/FixJ family response regulator
MVARALVADAHGETSTESAGDRRASSAWGSGPLREQPKSHSLPKQPTALRMARQIRRKVLRNPRLREGYTNEEIAEQLGCPLRTVERRLHLIRKKWQRGQAP